MAYRYKKYRLICNEVTFNFVVHINLPITTSAQENQVRIFSLSFMNLRRSPKISSFNNFLLDFSPIFDESYSRLFSSKRLL